MSLDPRTPVIVGAGQHLQRAHGLDDAVEPVELIAEAARRAGTDAGLPGLPDLDSIRVVRLLSWRYQDPGALIGALLGQSPRETCYTPSGGNTPQSLVNLTAREIAAGSVDCVLLCGGETWRTRMRSRKGGDIPLAWTKQPHDVEPTRMLGEEVPMSHPIEAAKGILQPVQIYPIFETALRAARGESIEAHIVRVSELWAAFSRVAAGNPYAWIRTAKTAEEIRTPSPSNRMIGLPYPKQMNSNNDVDMAAALLVCSVERAEALGIPRDRWVFLHAGTDAHDTYATSERWELHRVPAVRVAGQRALHLAGTGIDDIAFIDLYSCFPSMVQMSATELGIPLETERSLTQTGGLPFAGGPWNNYVMHAIATVVARCREHPGERGFIHANGGFATKHAFGVYSSEPPTSGFRWEDCQSAVDRLPTRGVADGAEAAGPARIEGYTVMHDRDGQPEFAIAACRRADDRRAWGTSRDRGVVHAMCHGEWVGRAVELDREGGLHP